MTTHPRVIALVMTAVLLPLSISTALIQPSFDDVKALPATASSVQAFNAYQAHFGDATQVQVILNDPGHDLRQALYPETIAQVATASCICHMSRPGRRQGR
ncbi:MAG TPA: hypothetical protein VFV38_53195 [Ktedonobacteraceae bacterium]|nr:hypothetical protein [Ktedonobacteraceae bacterium]